MKTYDCVAIGTAMLDTFVLLPSVEHYRSLINSESINQCFILGAKIDVSKIEQQSGGGASNASVTFARQRLSSVLISKVGDDVVGQIVLDELKNNGVLTGHIICETGGKTGQSVILVDPNAERTILTDRGSAGTLNERDLAVLSELKSRWVYLTSQNGSKVALDVVFAWALENGVKIAWNPGLADISHIRSKIKKLIAQTDLLIVNRDEASQLLGTIDTPDHLALGLRDLGAIRALVTDGARQMAIVDGQKIKTLEPNDIKAVDSTGAGDAMGSGTLAGLLQGLPFDRAVELGLANSEHVIMRVGAKTGIMYRR